MIKKYVTCVYDLAKELQDEHWVRVLGEVSLCMENLIPHAQFLVTVVKPRRMGLCGTELIPLVRSHLEDFCEAVRKVGPSSDYWFRKPKNGT